MRYRVDLLYTVEQSACIDIEADSEENAVKIADELAPSQYEEVSRNLECSKVEEIE